MENKDIMYVWDDTNFESDLGEVINTLIEDDLEKEDIVGYVLDVAEKQPVLYKNFDIRSLMQVIQNNFEDDRYDEGGSIADTLKEVFLKHIDFENLTKELEEVCLYYPEGKEYIITEEDYNNNNYGK